VSNALDTTIKAMASHILLGTVSLKNTNAMVEVATISKLFSSDAVEAVVIVSPTMSSIGAKISNATIAMI
jgi:hypothetical protein